MNEKLKQSYTVKPIALTVSGSVTRADCFGAIVVVAVVVLLLLLLLTDTISQPTTVSPHSTFEDSALQKQ
uniref:Uncharacterized protein n=1 Tax=Wuchereria bancrofti TaxID=6293 RepID=A0AAF5PJL9_WUCBA